MKIADGAESFFYQDNPKMRAQENLRKSVHEQLERIALIERLYVDPHDPTHRVKAIDVASSELEVEIYMRWQQRWCLTNAGRDIVDDHLARQKSSPHLSQERAAVAPAGRALFKAKVESMRFSPNETSLIVLFSTADHAVDCKTSDSATATGRVADLIREFLD